MLPEPLAARADGYGYSSFVPVGELEPDSFELAGQTIDVRSLGIQLNDSTRNLYLLVSRELPNYALLCLGTFSFPINESSTPPALGRGYCWDAVSLNSASGRTL